MISSVVRRDHRKLAPSSHDEADAHIMVHVADAAKEYKTVVTRAVDSDVVILAVFTFAHLMASLTGLWVAFGTEKLTDDSCVQHLCHN